ncbi:MAG: hypothetical protein WDZ93_02180 [Candidatus Paceibacterota bacterium]
MTAAQAKSPFQEVKMREVSLHYWTANHPDGTTELLLDKPAKAGLDQKKFKKELRVAAAVSKLEGKAVWWWHNGIKVSSDVCQVADPWAWLTEKNAEMGN